MLPDGKSNPDLPCDRRRYSPLYYRGEAGLSFFTTSQVNECKQSSIKMPSRVMCVDRVNAAETTARKWVSKRDGTKRLHAQHNSCSCVFSRFYDFFYLARVWKARRKAGLEKNSSLDSFVRSPRKSLVKGFLIKSPRSKSTKGISALPLSYLQSWYLHIISAFSSTYE